MSSPTASQTIGPFYAFALTQRKELGSLCGDGFEGERIRLRLRVIDGDGAPVTDGMVEIWQADAAGRYAHAEDPRHEGVDPEFRGFGRLSTHEGGVCVFDTVRPGSSDNQAAHVNVSIFARGLLNHLCTRVYFAGDPLLETDPVLALVPEDRRHSLIAHRDPENPSEWNLDIHLQGEDETVFFAV